MDFFVVFTVSFRLLYVLFVIRHGRRQIAHFNVTEHPTAAWVVQQLREAFPYDTAPKHFVFDRDSIFSAEVVRAVKSIGMKPSAHGLPVARGRTGRPNGGWAACRQELLDHVIVANEAHLRRLLRQYVAYHHEDRTHCGLEKQTPMRRAVQQQAVGEREGGRPASGRRPASSLRVAGRGVDRATPLTPFGQVSNALRRQPEGQRLLSAEGERQSEP